MDELIEIWLFFLPACLVPLVLYSTSLIFGQVSVLPADLNRSWKGRPLVGKGRGLWGPAAAMVAGGVCGIVQGREEEALVLALGAHLGTVVNSLWKRAMGIERGQDCPPLDHIDFVLGACLCYHIEFGLSPARFLAGVVVCGLAHRYLGRAIRWFLKDVERESI